MQNDNFLIPKEKKNDKKDEEQKTEQDDLEVILTEQVRKLHLQVRQKDQIISAMKETILSQTEVPQASENPSESTDTNGSETIKKVLPQKISQLFEQDQESSALSRQQIGQLIEMIKSPDQIEEG